MTQNNALKTRIRARMEMTGEAYNVARRKLEAVVRENLTVWELGEDGEAWFVEGTLDTGKAYEAVKQWLVDCLWGDMSSTDLPFSTLDESGYEARDDWFWKPVDPERHPEGEAYLKRKSDLNSGYTGEHLYTGVHLDWYRK